MSTNYVKRVVANISLDVALVESNWNWPSNAALEHAVQAWEQDDIAKINSDLQLFSRTRLKSCKLIKMLRDAHDAAWEIENNAAESLVA